jgi:peroxiredoxin
MNCKCIARSNGLFFFLASLPLRAFALASLALLCAVLLAGCKQEPAGTRLLGKPLEIQFKAVDGRDVNTAGFHGKVVLIDFWATWCPPCVQEVPNVKRAYETLHSRGFEIVGISLDDKKQDLLSFIKQNNMDWPQYFETSGVENTLSKKFGIEEIPTMWLVDKQGKLRDIDAVQNLAQRVEKLLAEP